MIIKYIKYYEYIKELQELDNMLHGFDKYENDIVTIVKHNDDFCLTSDELIKDFHKLTENYYINNNNVNVLLEKLWNEYLYLVN